MDKYGYIYMVGPLHCESFTKSIDPASEARASLGHHQQAT